MKESEKLLRKTINHKGQFISIEMRPLEKELKL